MADRLILRPQAGPQEVFLSCAADIALYGGSAGSGKSFALLLEPLRHTGNKDFGAVIFRRTIKQVKNEGGLWDESGKIYPSLGASPNQSDPSWRFPSGASIGFSHMEHERNIYDHQGSQICYLGFDELTHFSKKMFFYMLSRNRSSCGVRPYVRATTNPDKASWVRQFIDWWIYPADHDQAGYPIPERSGVVRFFVVEDDKVIWAATREELGDLAEHAKSFTFVSASVYDNKILLEKDPGYLANLKALPRVERLKLLGGNWDAVDKAGEYFRREWFRVVDAPPIRVSSLIRYWDRASSEKDGAAWTVGLKMGRTAEGQFIVLGMSRFRATPGKRDEMIRNIAVQDGTETTVWLEQDPGQAGTSEIVYLTKYLAGHSVKANRVGSAKTERAGPASSQAEVGNILVVKGDWNEDFFSETESFPEGEFKDIVDTLSGGVNVLTGNISGTLDESMSQLSQSPFILEEW